MQLNKELFARYADIKNKIKELEAEADVLAPDILAMVASTEERKVEADFGVFSIMTRKAYKYTEPTVAMANELKRRQEEEVATGEATFTESNFIKFNAPKAKNEQGQKE